jgi:hypothetical protein
MGGFAKLLFTQAKKNGQAAYVGDGNNRWSSVHVTDGCMTLRIGWRHEGANWHLAQCSQHREPPR